MRKTIEVGKHYTFDHNHCSIPYINDVKTIVLASMHNMDLQLSSLSAFCFLLSIEEP